MTQWRARFIVLSYAKLPDKFDLDQHECLAVPTGNVPTGLQSTMVDIFIEHNELEEAYFCGIDLIEELIDRSSFLSYGPSYSQLLSVTIPKIRIGGQFEIAIPTAYYHRSCVQLQQTDIESLNKKSNQESAIALRMFRHGISADTSYKALTDMWTAIETISGKSAKEAGKFVEHECLKCKARRQAGAASQSYIRQHFVDAKAAEMKETDASSAADRTRAVRGKLVHGGRLQNTLLRREVEKSLPLLQAATAVALIKDFNVKPKSRESQQLGLPYFSLPMIAVGLREFKPVEPCRLKFTWGRSQIPEHFADAQPVQFDIGIAFPVNIPEQAYPLVIPSKD